MIYAVVCMNMQRGWQVPHQTPPQVTTGAAR
jgi:hypothetical protein